MLSNLAMGFKNFRSMIRLILNCVFLTDVAHFVVDLHIFLGILVYIYI